MSEDPTPALVAVIEDDDASRLALGRLLRVGGFEPALFGSAEAFLASRPIRAWSCLIVDVQLTGMSGIDLQRRLCQDGPSVPIIITTGNRTDVIRERAREAGCTAFLWKPFSPDAILELVDSIAHPPAD